MNLEETWLRLAKFWLNSRQKSWNRASSSAAKELAGRPSNFVGNIWSNFSSGSIRLALLELELTGSDKVGLDVRTFVD